MTDLPAFDGPHFDALYRGDPDPWSVRRSWYERRKLGAVLAALPRERYGRGLELGCSVGATTEALAPRTDDLLAVDASAEALRLARRDVPHPHVRFVQASLPDEMPSGRWDLVVLGEIGYFLRPTPFDDLAERLPSALAEGGDLLAVHWRRDPDTLPQSGDDVHARLRRLPLRPLVRHEEPDFLLEVWRREA